MPQMIHKLAADDDISPNQSVLNQIIQVNFIANFSEKVYTILDVKPPVVKKRTKTKKELENQVN